MRFSFPCGFVVLFHLSWGLPFEKIGIDPYSYLVHFHLYTRKFDNKNESQLLYLNNSESIVSSDYSFTRPTKVIIHGFLSSYTAETVQIIKDAFIDEGDYNIIGVDWQPITKSGVYNLAAEETKHVGAYLGQMIDYLVSFGASLKDFHVIGHSLGAHVAGFAGKSVTSGKLHRITGLDPAGPLFKADEPDSRIDATDAEFVDCIHTCAGYYGMAEPICAADFYPNGGGDPQPGCDTLFEFGICSHSRSYKLFADSINKFHEYTTYKCPSVPDSGPDDCQPSDVLMGYPAKEKAKGIYFAYTGDEPPYSLISEDNLLGNFDSQCDKKSKLTNSKHCDMLEPRDLQVP